MIYMSGDGIEIRRGMRGSYCRKGSSRRRGEGSRVGVSIIWTISLDDYETGRLSTDFMEEEMEGTYSVV